MPMPSVLLNWLGRRFKMFDVVYRPVGLLPVHPAQTPRDYQVRNKFDCVSDGRNFVLLLSKHHAVLLILQLRNDGIFIGHHMA